MSMLQFSEAKQTVPLPEEQSSDYKKIGVTETKRPQHIPMHLVRSFDMKNF
jgi:hypothetical protein